MQIAIKLSTTQTHAHSYAEWNLTYKITVYVLNAGDSERRPGLH